MIISKDLFYFFQMLFGATIIGIAGSRKKDSLLLVEIPKNLKFFLFFNKKSNKVMFEFVAYQIWIYIISAIFFILFLFDYPILHKYYNICLVSIFITCIIGMIDNILYYIKTKTIEKDVHNKYKFFNIIMKEDQSIIVNRISKNRKSVWNDIYFGIKINPPSIIMLLNPKP